MMNEADMAYSRCIRCQTCDGFPCLVHAKSDAEVIAVRPALEHPNVTLLRNAQVLRLETDAAGTAVTEVVAEVAGAAGDASAADIVVVSCGAANSRRAAADVGQRQASGRACQRLRSGRAELHVPQQPGGAGAVADAERHDVPEDACAERLLLRHGRASSFRWATSR